MGERKSFGEYPFFAVAGLVAVLTIGLVVLGLELHWGVYSYSLIAVPVAVAGYYLVSYADLPVPPIAPTTSAVPEPPPTVAAPESSSSTAGTGAAPTRPTEPEAGPADADEPFTDPVEEADRIDRERTGTPPAD